MLPTKHNMDSHVGFVPDKVALGEVLVRVILLSSFGVIRSMRHNNSVITEDKKF